MPKQKSSSHRSKKRSITQRRVGDLWSKFTMKSSDTVICNICQRPLAYNPRYGPRNLQKHLDTHSKKSSRRSVKKSSRRSVKKSSRRSAKKSSRRSAKKSSRRSVKKSSRRSTKKSSRRSTKKSSRRSTKKSSRRSAKKSSRRSKKRSVLQKRVGELWNNFTQNSDNTVICNACKKELSYNSRFGPRNLRDHLETHGKKKSQQKKAKDVWEYFELLTGDRARCGVCNKEMNYNSRVGPQHLRTHLKIHEKRSSKKLMSRSKRSSRKKLKG